METLPTNNDINSEEIKETIKIEEKLSGTEEIPEEDEAEFVWDEYLAECNATAAAPTSFLHVEKSLQSCFTEDMKLEVPNKDNTETYWIASVILSCGRLLRLRYLGYNDDRSADFWCDIATNDFHPIGWCHENNKTLSPPSGIKDKIGNWKEFLASSLKDVKTVPQYLLEANGTTPVDLIKQGMKLEIQEKLNPTCVWIATILENVGGRLLLRYEGATPSDDFWLFYLSYRVHPVGWAPKNNYKYKPPEALTSKNPSEDWKKILKLAIEEATKMPVFNDLFENQEKIRPHKFKVGLKLEAVNPGTLMQFCPATVTEVLNDLFFLVQIDNHSYIDRQPQIVCCHADSPLIAPIDWAKSIGLKIIHPKGWLNYRQEFEWSEYLNYCKAEAAPSQLFTSEVANSGFEKGMKLEAVNPFQSNQICAATITKIVNNLMWIQLDSIDSFNSNHIVPLQSHDIFPVGWCESNHYPLKPPLITQGRGRLMKRVAIFIPDKQKKLEKTENACDGKAWCPKIYFNHRCFSGPYLSKGRIAELPRDVGPGPVTLVLKEVLSKLINVAYKSSKVLHELQLKGKSNPNMYQCFLKAKYKGKSYRGIVEVLQNSEHTEEFCRNICLKLECCPYLFGPTYVGNECPEQCSRLTKTKYNGSYGKKKRKITRPVTTEADLKNGVKVAGKRGRKRKIVDPENNNSTKEKAPEIIKEVENDVKHMKENVDEKVADEELKDAGKQKRKYVRYIPPKSDIVTRGAKLPNFAFGMHWRKKKKHDPLLREFESIPSPVSRDSSEDNSKATSETQSECNTDSVEDKESITQEVPPKLMLESNPLHWSVEEVIQFMKETDCAQMVRLLKEQDIDGQALLLLTLPIVQEHLELKLGPAIKLCHQVERIKLAFFSQYAK